MSNVTQSSVARPVSTWRKVLAAVLDFVFILVLAGYAIAYVTGNVSDQGFDLQGAPAFALFAIVILYFVIFSRFLGGTVWQRLLGVR